MKNSLMNRNRGYDLFDGFFDDMFADPFFTSSNNIMRTDITEKDGNYILDIELPGFKKEDVNIELNDGYLTVSAKTNESDEEKDKKGNIIRSERYYGNASRSYYVGEDVKPEDIKAKYDNGVLKLTLPSNKPEVKKIASKIEID